MLQRLADTADEGDSARFAEGFSVSRTQSRNNIGDRSCIDPHDTGTVVGSVALDVEHEIARGYRLSDPAQTRDDAY